MAATTKRIGVFICTTRQPRCNPQIANFVIQSIQSLHPSPPAETSAPPYSLHTVDLAEWKLPFVDEPEIPSQLHDPSKYVHEHTRKWSAEVSSYDGFVFVTPQYNWGYPAVLKNAIDYLYDEWKNKAALVVSYGGRGGGRSNAQLRQVLQAVKITPTTKSVELKFPSRQFLEQAASGKQLELDGRSEGHVWSDERREIGEAFAELLTLLSSEKLT
ncbi:hypothetical protein DV736_g4524, partial [Chaetothyriales sp. CBS 134916]